MSGRLRFVVVMLVTIVVAAPLAQETGKPTAGASKDDPRVERLKNEALADVERMATFTQQMVDQIFSYGELGFRRSRRTGISSRF